MEYLLQVLVRRIAYTELRLGQLKIMQEVITPCMFVPFAVDINEPLKLDDLWAGLCLIGAVNSIFRSS